MFNADLEVKQYLNKNKLNRGRTNHNQGCRVTYLKCAHDACPKKLRLLHNLVENEGASTYEIEEVLDTAHNHQVVIPRNRGLSIQQKNVVDLCVDRGQSAPKKVILLNFLSEKLGEILIKEIVTSHADNSRIPTSTRASCSGW
jgi:hypothetical protein